MLKNENTELKIQIESMRFQISTLQKEQNQRAGRGSSEDKQPLSRSHSGLEGRSKSIDGVTSKGFLLEKYKNQKLK